MEAIQYQDKTALWELVRVPPNTLLVGHAHHSAHVLVVLDGWFVEDGTVMCAGDVRVSSPQDQHLLRFGDSETTCLLAQLASEDERIAGRRVRLAKPGLAADACRVGQAICDQSSSVSGVGRRLLDQVLELQRPGRPDATPLWLRAWRDRSDAEINLGERAVPQSRSHSKSREHASRMFRRHFGTSFALFRRFRRVSAAAPAVVAGHSGLAEIAASCGFSDQSHMTREFVLALGRTPGSLRRTAKRHEVTSVQDSVIPPSAILEP